MAKYIGCHVSIAKGYLAAARQALHIGARAFQYFPKNPRQLSVKHYDQQDARACADYCQQHKLKSIAHAPYPLNLAAPDVTKRRMIIKSVLNDLDIAQHCGSIGVVVHFGWFKGDDPLEGYRLIIETLNTILDQWEGDAMLLLENQAGQKGKMGMTLEELVRIRSLTDFPHKIGFCFDTCHAFASGLLTSHNWHDLLKQGEALGYFEHLYAVHFNDSVYPVQSYRDRHANIGQGKIGLSTIQAILETPLLEDVPFILETPKGPDGTHRREIRRVKSLSEN
ncbi:deoxyribonuclease-4 [Caldalkalibacillus uzonensis]|uniref:Deoxyribonuclease-4 n=1 Tax=Caldalkalibacillus uzonensis TaxID=353224 RepID=A0ABU0CM73_9BACI|nr:deoxyribonuclease IV [Caldalkalibacillus uzonensis]MDQ0337513.1 deoxyribonuclease-4 [Caldalkalibacillus uzonensis]